MRYFIKRRNNLSRMAGSVLMAFAVVLVWVSSIDARTLTARDVFERLQTPAFETLKKSVRLDMLDYWDVDSVYHAKNAIGGESWIEKMTPGYAKVRLTPVSTCEIKLLPVKNDTVVMTIYTVGDENEFADSEIAFFDRNLIPLEPARFFRMPSVESFFNIGKGTQPGMAEIKEMVEFPGVVFEASPDDDRITGRLMIGPKLDVDLQEKVVSKMVPEVSMSWRNGVFQPDKGKNKKMKY